MALVASCLPTAAEDIVQILPTVTFAGATEDDEQFLEVQMVNDTYDEVGIVSFDLLLPEGIHFLYEDFEGDRVPFTKKGKNISYDFSLFEPTLQASGFSRYLLIPGGQLRPITGQSGTFMYLYIEVDEDVAPGIYPILIQETVIGKSETEGLYPALSASYIVVKASEDAASPLDGQAHIDLSGMTGYVPSFVVEAMNADLAQCADLVSVDLSGAAELGAALQVPENALWHTATEAGLQRTLPAGQWSTVCLPFALSTGQTVALKDQGVEIEQLSDFDGTTVTFSSADEMLANHPYIVKCEAESAPFAALQDVSAEAFEPTDVTAGTLTMRGAYERLTLNSSEDVAYYVFNAANGDFVRIGQNGTILPFRAYLENAGGQRGSRLRVVHGGGVATGLQEATRPQAAQQGTASSCYDLQGRRLQPSAAGKGIICVQQGKKTVVK